MESFLQPGRLASFTATGLKGSELAAFENSHIAANIVGGVKLGTINTVNGGVPFGVTASTASAA